ncbi:Bax inhibitor-1/YccA family protein [Gilvimarinus algae]|uniref:Bax inhibitor-1/YccA family protein n=1 Tax=Gilvimarinus algae TaxID=3058037 RepID=A0ABT8TDV1_9GAMM|nr:Bax inhibitor-1/YccA family protein [Gilvimarinus sp. SDUM040014]MDO3382289.1 Bax inhibitor-1/YccA family protein [Gilvimarinus sp. SDUM040014]
MEQIRTVHSAVAQSAEVSRVLRNTYLLLAITLAFSAVTAGAAMALNLGQGAGLVMSLVALGLIWFVLPKTANSATGLVVVFAFTGLIGASLGPILNHYLSMNNGSGIVMQALGGTALTFLGLSGYALVSRKDFSFLHGFVAMGLMVMIGCMLLLLGASLFGFHLEVLSLAFSAGVIILMSALILFQTSAIIHGGERNYLLATTSLYLSIINIFTSLLHLLGAAED